MKKNTVPLARKDNLVIQEMDGEILVYDLQTYKAFCLNQTSGLVWQNCDGKKNTSEIAKELEKTFGTAVNEDVIWYALDQLNSEGLLEKNEEIPNKFAGLSRREAVRRIGLASAIALPIVAGMVAPMAINAQSGCFPLGGGVMNVPGCPCDTPSDCTGGSCMTPSTSSPTGMICT